MTQNEAVLKQSKEKEGITSFEAFQMFGITRLAARIGELEDMGHIFGRETVQYKGGDGKKHTYVRYKWMGKGGK